MIVFFEDNVERTRNPRSGAKRPTYVHRKQCTFALPGSTTYDFGQTNKHFVSPEAEWPPLVRRALADARERAGEEKAPLYNAVHANLYPHGGAGVMPHQDNETGLTEGLPIFSYTYLEDASLPRPFSIYAVERDGSGKRARLEDIPLGDGDVLVMKGRMQKDYYHGVEKVSRKKHGLARINLPVRALAPEG